MREIESERLRTKEYTRITRDQLRAHAYVLETEGLLVKERI